MKSKLFFLLGCCLSLVTELRAQTITQLEYFFDNNLTNRTIINNFSPAEDAEVTTSIPVNSLNEGFHRLNMRAKDELGAWGLFKSTFFYKGANPINKEVAKLEYYIDSMDVNNHGERVITIPGDDVTDTFVIDLSQVEQGYHTLFVRAFYRDGTWGLPVTTTFYREVSTELSMFKNIEYFIDYDASYGVRNFPLDVEDDSIQQSFIVDLTGIPLGDHVLYARIRDKAGRTSLMVLDSFKVVDDVPPTVFVQGSVQLQGRPAIPNQAWSVPVDIDLYRAGEKIPFLSFQPTTNQSGEYDLGGLPGVFAGDYVLTAKNDHTLAVGFADSFVAGFNTVDFDELPEGDANQDNRVTVLDFSKLAASFNLVQGKPGFDPQTDFNENKQVTILDFSLLAFNFNKDGYRVNENSFIELTATNNRVFWEPRIYTKEDVQIYYEWDDSELLVKANTHNQLIDGAEFHLSFDPSKLQVGSLIGSDKLYIPLLSHIDNQQGMISFAAGTVGELPSGDFELARISMQVNSAPGEQKPELTFTSDGPGETQLTYAGKSVLNGIVNGIVDWQDCGDCPQGIEVYPNPTTGLLHFNMSDQSIRSISITDVNGKLIRKIQNLQNHMSFNISDQPVGVYMLVLEHEEKVLIRKIYKQ